ncbi:purine and uridine phosphorylase [Trichoderma barbatum]
MADRDLYTVGWICAITTELVAALALLDERHDRPKELDPHDSNNYELGMISNHYVAIACLPEGEYGTAAAADVATNLLRSFPNIRIGLMVGIGGGAPTGNHDIRLGDVVVSTPGDGQGGVFQYDFGRTIQNQVFIVTDFLDQPPRLLRTAVAGLKARYEIDGHSLSEEVDKALEKNPRLQKRYHRPQTGDRLYKSSFIHVSGASNNCQACGDDPSSLMGSLLVIVIDALDECENDKDIRVILHLLSQVQEFSSIRLRAFITSRPELPMRLGFDAMGGSDYQDLILHQIPRADIQHDIRLFLEYRLADIRKIRSLPQGGPV